MRILVSKEQDDRKSRGLLETLPGVNVSFYDPNSDTLPEELRAAEILIPPYRGTHRGLPLIPQLPNLKMVQLPSAGVDEWIAEVPSDVVLTSARGAHARPVSEWVLSAILTQLRHWPTLVRFQDAHTWAHRRFNPDTLFGMRALIIGAGSIGNAVARRLEPFDVTTTLVAANPRPGVHAADEIPNLISGHELVVITAPINDKTFGLVDKDFLAAMDDGALLVNAGRGQIVVTDALVAELQSGRLRAALDVTDPEPLPDDHPLWDCTNAIISPHAARTVPGTNTLVHQIQADQIGAFIRGETPSNAVLATGIRT